MVVLVSGDDKLRWLNDVIERDSDARYIVLVGGGGSGKTHTVTRAKAVSERARQVPAYVYSEVAEKTKSCDPRTWTKDKDQGDCDGPCIIEALPFEWEDALKEYLGSERGTTPSHVRVAFFA